MNVTSRGGAPERRGGVVACVEGPAADAGAIILRAGGNATDAAIATAFAQGVVNPIYAGIGGSFHGLFFNNGGESTVCVSSGGRAPHAATAGMWKVTGRWGNVWTVEGNRNRYGYQASLVPGFVRGAHAAFQRCGSGNVTWSEVVAPSIELARGFEVYPYLYRLWMPSTERFRNFLESGDGPTLLSQTKECERIYLKDGRHVYEIGDQLVQREYAETLTAIALKGPDEFYEGETAKRIVEDFQRNGGLITSRDLAEYRPDILEPLQGQFQDLTILTEPPPSVGLPILEVLGILNGIRAQDLGWNTGEYLDKLARSMHTALRDRMVLLGDPEFVDVPVGDLLSEAYIRDQQLKVLRGSGPMDPADATRDDDAVHSPMSETTHVSVMDAQGNVASVTHSLGMSSGVVTPKLGFQHNCQMVMFDPLPGRPNSIAPGKRPLTGGGPVIAFKDRAPSIAIGSPGGAWKVSGIAQAIMNVEAFGMTIHDAVVADRIHVDDDPKVIFVEPHFPPDPLIELSRSGFRIAYEWYSARLCAVRYDPVMQTMEGASDPRGGRGLAVV